MSREHRDKGTPGHILHPVTSASELTWADLVLEQCDLQSTCPCLVTQDSSVWVVGIAQIPDRLVAFKMPLTGG